MIMKTILTYATSLLSLTLFVTGCSDTCNDTLMVGSKTVSESSNSPNTIVPKVGFESLDGSDGAKAILYLRKDSDTYLSGTFTLPEAQGASTSETFSFEKDLIEDSATDTQVWQVTLQVTKTNVENDIPAGTSDNSNVTLTIYSYAVEIRNGSSVITESGTFHKSQGTICYAPGPS